MANVQRIFDLLENYHHNPVIPEIALAGKSGGSWTYYSVDEYIQNVNDLSIGLQKLGVKKGDNVVTILNNCPEWNFFDMALMQVGAVQVPVYPTISESNYEYILNEIEAEYVIVSNQEIYVRIKNILPKIKTIKKVYSIEETAGLSHWSEIPQKGTKKEVEALEQIKAGIQTDDVATIIYTSGTTGNPKGVMLSHKNFIYNFQAATEILSHNPVKTALSFLPLCHVYERMLNYMYQNVGISIYYCDKIDKLRDYMKEVHPEIFGAVPRVIEKTYDKLVKAGRNLKGIKKQLFFWALNLAHHFDFNRGPFYTIQLKIADKLIYSKWRQAFGGELKVIVSGGATLNPRLARTFRAANIKINEGYGLTETSPVIAVSTFLKGGTRFGTVGPVMDCAEIKFAEDGEILTKGPCLMKGYYKQPELTDEVIDKEGWFHTGDIGELIDNKYLKITDRKKEIFKTSGGKYIAPQVIENKFKESSFIENIIIVGENKQYITALVVPNFEHIESWCEVKEHPYKSAEDAVKDEKIVKRIQREVNGVNESLDRVEQVKKFKLLSKAWSVEEGELSPTLKLKRNVIQKRYGELIDGMY